MNRIEFTAASKTASKRASKTASKTASKRATMLAQKHGWSHVGVGMTVCMSAGLNGYANAMHASIPFAGAVLGCTIPCLVFVLAKVAGMQWRTGARMLARFTGAVGAGLLCLSVWHCACSLSLLTGSHIMLALPMAIAIDCGLVACEIDIVLT